MMQTNMSVCNVCVCSPRRDHRPQREAFTPDRAPGRVRGVEPRRPSHSLVRGMQIPARETFGTAIGHPVDRCTETRTPPRQPQYSSTRPGGPARRPGSGTQAHRAHALSRTHARAYAHTPPSITLVATPFLRARAHAAAAFLIHPPYIYSPSAAHMHNIPNPPRRPSTPSQLCGAHD